MATHAEPYAGSSVKAPICSPIRRPVVLLILWLAIVILVGCRSRATPGARSTADSSAIGTANGSGSSSGDSVRAASDGAGRAGGGTAGDGSGADESVEPGASSGESRVSGISSEEGADDGDDDDGAEDSEDGLELDIPQTRRSRRLSSFLEQPARRALARKRWAEAVSLYQALTLAHGPGSREALALSRAWAGAGQHAEAIMVLDGFLAVAKSRRARRRAEKRRRTLTRAGETAPRGFAPARVAKYAREAFRRGRSAFGKKRYADALVYFQMGYSLDPELPGFLREIGATYDKLGLADKKQAFYQAYVKARPFGKTSNAIRRKLLETQDSLGELSVESSLPCDELWLNRQRAPGDRSIKTLRVPPGEYRALCVSYDYEIAYFEYGTVVAGRATRLRFQWAIIVNKLREPFGRVVIENPRVPGLMMDLGISSPEVGVIVPEDGRALSLVLRGDGGNRREARSITLQPGRRYVIQW